MLSTRAFELLVELRANDEKPWFDERRDEIARELQAPFEAVLRAVSDELAEGPVPLRGGRETMCRMSRDVRFSRDRSPYNTHVSGLPTRSGTEAETSGLVYLHLDTEGGFVAAGRYKLAPKELGPLRACIVADPDAFREVLDGPAAAGPELSRELTAMPQGYAAHADAWYAPYLKLQAFMVRRDLGRGDWTSGGVARVAARSRRAAGLVRFGSPD